MSEHICGKYHINTDSKQLYDKPLEDIDFSPRVMNSLIPTPKITCVYSAGAALASTGRYV